MSITTITHDEFEELLKTEGVYGAVAIEPSILVAHGGTFEEAVDPEPKSKGLRVVFLNVAEPKLYTDRSGKSLIILPHIASLTYDMIGSFHPEFHPDDAPNYEPWAFTIAPYVGAELDEMMYWFRDGRDEDDGNRRLPAFALADPRTH